MRVFVTGATGFIGSTIVRDLLAVGHEVTGLVRSDAGERTLRAVGARAQRGTIEDLASLQRGASEADGVIHTAFFHAISHMNLATRLHVMLGGRPSGIVTRFVGAAVKTDRAAIQALASAMKGRDRALIAAFPTLALKLGQIATEEDAPDPQAPGGPRGQTERTIHDLAASGIRACVVRLPPMVYGRDDRAGLLPQLYKIARKKGVSAYVDAGTNRWPAVHVEDAANLFRLALEGGTRGEAYHAVSQEGVQFRQVAEVLGEQAAVPTATRSRDEAGKAFGFLAPFVPADNPVTSALTQERLAWRPTQTDLLTTIHHPDYFRG